MAAIDQKLIDRINVLAKKKKEGTITPEELKEQDKLRKEYIKLFREGFKSQLKAIKVVDEKGNDITPLKLKQEKLKKCSRMELNHRLFVFKLNHHN